MQNQHLNQLEELLTGSIRLELKDVDSACISYSGGLDCSVIAFICSKLAKIKLHVVGTESSLDMKSAVTGAEILNLPLDKTIITKSDVEQALPHLVDILQSRNALEISIELSLYFVCKYSSEKVIIMGQGADELFGGYSRYLRMKESEREERMRFDVANYIQYNLKQEQKLARAFDKVLVMPYISQPLIKYAEAIPMDLKIHKNERKYILKLLARKIGLPDTIVDKPKKAVQYGSGMLNLLKELSKEENFELHEYLKRI